MINKHLADAEIQQYVLQKANADAAITDHIRHCINCKIKTEQYRLLLDGIKEQEKPAFDFNLADLVMEQLPGHQPAVVNENPFFYFIVFIACLSFCVGCYFFGNKLLNLFGGITPILGGLILTTVASLLVFLCIDMYKRYQIKMRSLNFY
jgi:hypothetical protein